MRFCLAMALALAPMAHAQRPSLVHTFDTPEGPLTLHSATTPGSQATLPAGSGFGFLPLGSGIEGDMPIDVTMTLDGRTAIVVCRDTDSIEWFDALTGARLGHTLVDERPIDVVLSEDGTQAFVACYAAGTVVALDVASRQVTDSYSMPGSPHRVMPVPGGTEMVVGCDVNGSLGRFVVLDLASGAIARTINTSPQSPIAYTLAPWAGVVFNYYPDFAITPDGASLVFADFWGYGIDVIDIASGALVHGLDTGTIAPSRVDVSRSGSFAAVSCMSFTAVPSELVTLDLGTLVDESVPVQGIHISEVRITPDESTALIGTYTGVDAIDLASGNPIGSLPGGSALGAIEFTSDDAYAITAFWDASIVDLSTLTVVGSVPASLMQRVAINPVANQAIALSPAVDERLEAFTTNGASAQPTWSTPVGVPVEVDGPYSVDLTADGRTAVVSCPVSSNLAVVDLVAEQHTGTVSTSAPTHHIAVDPDGEFVVAGLDLAERVAVIELPTGQTLVEFPVTGEIREVLISSDGTRAFVRSLDGAQTAVTFVDVDGANSHVTSEVLIQESSLHLSLSPDEQTLALTRLGGRVTLLDPVAESILTTLNPGPSSRMPVWSSDSSLLGWPVSTHSLALATIDGANSSLQVIGGQGLILGLEFDADVQYAYVVAGIAGGRLLNVVRLSDSTIVTNVLLPGFTGAASHYPHWVERVGDQLLVVRTEFDARLWRASMAGPATALLENVDLPDEGTYGAAFSHSLGQLILPASTDGDGLRQIDFGGGWENYCGPAVPNSTGMSATLSASGSFLAGAQPFRLDAALLPPNTFGMFLVSAEAGSVQPPGSEGILCLGGSIGRFANHVQATGAAGEMSLDVDLTALPLGSQVDVQPGDLWRFQAWFRDQNPSATSNFTEGLSAEFR